MGPGARVTARARATARVRATLRAAPDGRTSGPAHPSTASRLAPPSIVAPQMTSEMPKESGSAGSSVSFQNHHARGTKRCAPRCLAWWEEARFQNWWSGKKNGGKNQI